MTEKNYGIIKDGNVINVLVFDDLYPEIIDSFKEELGADLIVEAQEGRTQTGGTWDGERFWKPSPYPSWVMTEDGEWFAPVPMPVFDPEDPELQYTWDEETISWKIRTEA